MRVGVVAGGSVVQVGPLVLVLAVALALALAVAAGAADGDEHSSDADSISRHTGLRRQLHSSQATIPHPMTR